MRVISGIARGHKLDSLAGLNTRPTTDRIKESLFNMLAADLPDCIFLDLFSGSGAIGIEAISRAAKKAVFIDNSAESCNIIKKNLEHTKFSDKAELIKSDVLQALPLLNDKFDIIFLDPPYAKGFVTQCLQKISELDILNENAYIVCELGSKDEIPELEVYRLIKIKKYKTTNILFFSFNNNGGLV